MKKIRVSWKVNTVNEFLTRHGSDITHDSIFLYTKTPMEPGVQVRFELLLADQNPFLAGTATVADDRVNSRGRPGMLLRFDEVDLKHERRLSALMGGDEEETRPELEPGSQWDRVVGPRDSAETD